MKKKANRLDAIKMIISSKEVGSQEELLQELNREGFELTQATLSRDLKMLKTTKVPTDRGSYVYTMPDSNTLKDKLIARGQFDANANFQSGFISLQLSQNVAVIKTRNGYAAGIAYDIDMHNFPEIIGTIPGSDTIFAIIAEGVSHERVRRVLAQILPIDVD